jgi:hypothetical protein
MLWTFDDSRKFLFPGQRMSNLNNYCLYFDPNYKQQMLFKSGKAFRGNVWYYTTVSWRHPLCFVQQIPSVPVRGIRNLRNAEKLSSYAPVNTRVLLWQHTPFHPYIRKQLPLPLPRYRTYQ